MLQEGDQDEPVINPEIRADIRLESSEETIGVASPYDASQPNEDADIGDNDILVLAGCEHDSVGVEVVASLGVLLLACCVPDKVHREPKYLETSVS